MKQKQTLYLLIGAGVIVLAAIGFFVFRGFGGGYTPESRSLHFEAPIHFLSADLEKAFPSKRAIPNPGVIRAVEGASLSIQTHPDDPGAQLRVIQLPRSYLSTKNTAEVLAQSGAAMDGDILLVFRPEWAPLNGYGNIQLGITHSSLCTIQGSGGGKHVHTVENPLSYSSPLNYRKHYAAHDVFHIVRPNLSSAQRKNVKDWAFRVLGAKDRVPFFGNYGLPYAQRDVEKPLTGNLPVDLALVALDPELDVELGTYCSELVWGILALRDIKASQVGSRFGADQVAEAAEWIAARLNPIFDPIPAATANPSTKPGLVQGPDVQMRNLIGNDNDRRGYLLENVLFEKMRNPSAAQGIMSSGHLQTAIAYQPKVLQLRHWYGPKEEDSTFLPEVNDRVYPNYSPTAFFFMANSRNDSLNYVATVSFRSDPVDGE